MCLPPPKEDFNLKRILRQPLVREWFWSCCLKKKKYAALQNELSLFHTYATGEKLPLDYDHLKAIFFVQMKENEIIWSLKEQEIIWQ